MALRAMKKLNPPLRRLMYCLIGPSLVCAPRLGLALFDESALELGMKMRIYAVATREVMQRRLRSLALIRRDMMRAGMYVVAATVGIARKMRWERQRTLYSSQKICMPSTLHCVHRPLL